MGVTNPPIAKSKEEYVLMCIDLIKSTNKRSSLKKEIQEKAHRLQTTNVINKELEIFVRKSIEMSRLGEYLPTDWRPRM